MWSTGPLKRERTQDETPRFPLHNIADDRRQGGDGHADDIEEAESPGASQDRHPSQSDGTWGERDVGGPLSRGQAMSQYEVLRHELETISRSRSRTSTGASLSRKSSNISRKKSRNNVLGLIKTISSRGKDKDLENATSNSEPQEEYEEPLEEDQEGAAPEEEDFHLDDYLREGHMEKRAGEQSAKRLGVIFKNLTVKGVGSTATTVKTLPDAILGTFGPDLYHLVTRFVPFLKFGGHGEKRILVNDFTGVVRDGEMMLVLGRPGAGCTTFLKTIANNRDSYAEVTGEVSYGGITAERQRKLYRGEVNYNPEDDVHFADLNVLQTFTLALLTKTKKRDRDEIPVIVDALLRMFGISHTKYTKVGNEYIRGISGGERKRVSIAETLATKSSVLCWDNSTRGLDASTALDYAKSLRIMTDVSNKATLVTLYQAGQGIYDLMDKVMVIHSGRCVYEGPAKDARQYFIDLGFEAPDRQTTADFLTACTDEYERRFRPGCEDSCPKTAEELEAAFRKSEQYKRILADVETYEKHIEQTDYADAKEFEQTVKEGKSHRTVLHSSPYTVSFFRQVMAASRREFWLLFGDTTTLYTKAFIIVANALIVSSLFYGQPLTSAGAFSRGGTLFFGILFLGWLQLTELMKAVSGRAVVARHRDYAFYRPSAVSVARILTDFPVLAPQVIIFSVVVYFMTGLSLSAGKFFIYLLFVYTTTICLTALYRMFAALSPSIDDAVRFSGISLNLLVIFTGYVIPKPQLVSDYIWFGWLYYINPLSYSFEAVLSNEFSDRQIDCDPLQLVPQGPNVDPAHQGCNLRGSAADSTTIGGAAYLESTYNYSRSNLWRNFGVVIAYTVLYILVTLVAVEVFNFAKEGGGAIVFKKTRRSKKQVQIAAPADEEKGAAPAKTVSSGSEESSDIDEEKALAQISSSESIFTWKDVNLTVPYLGGQKKLLNNVSGYAKPGLMIALMGASGAGKTTLLNTLAQRNGSMGVITGDMLVDGRPLGPTFQRGTGFCEQMDIHDGTATIREALEFSAILRQDRTVPRAEKIAYVDTIIDLLELNSLQDAIISSLGVEQRKRLTIGVELAAKPQLLLFLDEPTSGLDSQSAYSIVRFLRKLSRAGQAIVCTIHQPSSMLIQQFDMILALNPGGNTFYFGPVGESGSAVVKYFADRGFDCPPGKNVAEFILETAAKSRRRPDGTRVDWNAEWRKSDNRKELEDEIDRIISERSKVPQPDPGTEHEYAATVWTQTVETTKRIFRQHWRDPSYLYGKIFVSVIVGIFNGFTFWQLGNSIVDMQNRMFSAFLIITIPPTIVNGVVPKFFTNMMLWMSRELPSRIYGWQAFTTAQVVGEIPMAIFTSVLYFVLWYFPSGLPTDSSVSGFTFLMVMLFFLFQASWGQWITAFAPNFTVIANTLPFFFVMFSLFNGIVRPYEGLPVFWKYWMYYVNPSTWWTQAVLGATLHNVPVICAPEETAKFTPPPGQTCLEYAGAYAESVGGYLVAETQNLSYPDVCQFCQYTSGDGYLGAINTQYEHRWRAFGLFLVFVATNYMLVYFFIWSIRIKGWKFGMGWLFGGLGKLWDLMISPLKKLQKKQGKEAHPQE